MTFSNIIQVVVLAGCTASVYSGSDDGINPMVQGTTLPACIATPDCMNVDTDQRLWIGGIEGPEIVVFTDTPYTSFVDYTTDHPTDAIIVAVNRIK